MVFKCVLIKHSTVRIISILVRTWRLKSRVCVWRQILCISLFTLNISSIGSHFTFFRWAKWSCSVILLIRSIFFLRHFTKTDAFRLFLFIPRLFLLGFVTLKVRWWRLCLKVNNSLSSFFSCYINRFLIDLFLLLRATLLRLILIFRTFKCHSLVLVFIIIHVLVISVRFLEYFILLVALFL